MTTALLLLTSVLASSPAETAAHVDRAFPRVAVCADEDFLRRVSLDLIGRPPTLQELTLFVLDPTANKRDAVIDRLVASDEAAARWARYWTEVVYSRATDERAVRMRGSLEGWLSEQFAAGTAWDDVVSDLLTATGDARENGATGLLVAHAGEATEVASEASRIFNGLQISCANCHDHPSDPWTREQFHQVAAFFPRVNVTRRIGEGPPTLIVSSVAGTTRRPDAAQIMRLADRDRDGRVTSAEAARIPRLKDQFATRLMLADEDGDGALSRSEFETLLARVPANNVGRGSAEHRMPNLEDPNRPGRVMQPVSFVTGDALPSSAGDLERRLTAAAWITSPKNPWFARAVVNRYWAELIGEGFVTPVDDLGPTRSVQHEAVLDLLCEGFVRSEYDLHWLLAAITRTTAYQRADGSESDLLPVVATRRLDADQMYGSLRVALSGRADQSAAGATAYQRDPRAGSRAVFGEDPSTPQADRIGTLPQALLLMNSAVLEFALSQRARQLSSRDSGEGLIRECFLSVLCREPLAEEIRVAADAMNESDDPAAGCGDLLWALTNTAEFLHQR